MIENPEDLAALKEAVALLESTSLTMQLSGLIGKPIEWAIERLPQGASEKIQNTVRTALSKSMDGALFTMPDAGAANASNNIHLGLVAASGAIGGFFGFAGTLMELPVSTTIMMRSVADIARSEGFDVTDPFIKTECLQIFAMGGPNENDDAADSAYYGMRNAMVAVANEVGRGLAEVAARQAAAATSAHVNGMGLFSSAEVGSLMVRVIEAVAGRFGVQVTEKMAAQAVPVVGALSGALINSMFMNHFQDIAKGHFTVLRLERIYGQECVKAHYRIFRNTPPSSRNG